MHMMDFIGMKRIGQTDEGFVLETPVTEAVLQPDGIVHGGLSAMLAESAASNAARATIDLSTHYTVGLEVSSTHLMPVM